MYYGTTQFRKQLMIIHFYQNTTLITNTLLFIYTNHQDIHTDHITHFLIPVHIFQVPTNTTICQDHIIHYYIQDHMFMTIQQPMDIVIMYIHHTQDHICTITHLLTDTVIMYIHLTQDLICMIMITIQATMTIH